MKINKSISALGLALTVASVAEAQQTIYISGSTAFRAQVYLGLQDMGLTVQAGATTGNNNFNFTGTVNKSTISTLTNGSAGQSVNVICAFTGSTGGFNTLLHQVSPVYTNIAGSAFSYPNGADLCFADSQQSSTFYANQGTLNEIVSVDGAASSFGTGIAVVTLTWACSADAEGKIANLTPFVGDDIFVNGFEPLSYFNNNPSNSAVNVYLTGRDTNSGSRVIATQTAGFDPLQPIIQYAVGGLPDIATVPVSGTFQNVGDVGYASGGSVAKALSVPGAGDAIGYVSMSDATSLKNGAIPINFYGVSPFVGSTWTANSTPWNFAAIENGAYTMWGYEHLNVSPLVSTTSFIYTAFGPDLVNAIEYEIVHPQAGAVQSADLIKNLNVHRNADGTDVLPGN